MEMELDKSFATIRNVLMNLEATLCVPLKNIKWRDQENISIVIGELGRHGFFSERDEIYLRKIHYSLLLNTDLKVRNILSEDHNCGHIVDVFPCLSASVYAAIIVEFNLLRYLKETILYAPIALVVDILKTVIKKQTKYLNLEEYPYFNAEILKTIFGRLQSSSLSSSSGVNDATYKALVYFFKNIASSFNLGKIPNKFKNDKEKYVGYTFYYLLRLLKECALLSVERKTSTTNNVYTVDSLKNESFWYPNTTDDEIKDPLSVCYELLIAKCKVYMTELYVDEYMQWDELQFENSQNLQFVVREQAANLLSTFCENSTNNNNTDHSNPSACLFLSFRKAFNEIRPLLSSIAIPEQNTDGDKEKVTAETNRKRVFSLLSNGTLINEPDVMNLIVSGEVSLNYDDMVKFASSAIWKISSVGDIGQDEQCPYLQSLKDAMLFILKNLPYKRVLRTFKEDIAQVERIKLNELLSTDVVYLINDILSTDDLIVNIKSNAKFIKNLVISGIINMNDVFTVLLNCAVESYTDKLSPTLKILKSICATKYNNANIIQDLFLVLQNITCDLYSTWNNDEKTRFKNLVCCLITYGIISAESLVFEYFMKVLNLNEANMDKLIDRISIVQAFIECIDLRKRYFFSIDFLTRLVEIMEYTRNGLDSFHVRSKILCDDVGKIIENFFPETILSITDLITFKTRLQYFSTPTVAYFWGLYVGDAISPNLGIRLMLMMRKPNVNINRYLQNDLNRLILIFCKIFLTCTASEMYQYIRNIVAGDRTNAIRVSCVLFGSLRILHHFVMTNYSSDATLEWFFYTVKIYLNVLQQIFMPLTYTEDSAFIVSYVNFAIECLHQINARTQNAALFNTLKCIHECVPTIQSTNTDIQRDNILNILSMLRRNAISRQRFQQNAYPSHAFVCSAHQEEYSSRQLYSNVNFHQGQNVEQNMNIHQEPVLRQVPKRTRQTSNTGKSVKRKRSAK